MSKLRKFNVPVGAAKAADSNQVSRICGLADGGEIEKAAEEAAALMTRGAYAVAPFTVWLAAGFADAGPAALPKLLRTAALQLAADETARVAALSEWGPAFTWFVDNVRSRVRFHAKFHDQTWARWCAGLTSNLEQELDAAADEFVRAAAGAPEAVSIAIGDLNALLQRNFGGLIPTDDAANDDEAGAESGASDVDLPDHEQESSYGAAEFDADDAEETAFARVMEPRPRAAVVAVRSAEEPQGSVALRALQAKLSAFARLAGEQSWPMAAMVARDIERELSQFDPVRYFPHYFSNYLNTLCEVGAELELHMQPADSLESQALERLYHADPERFLEQLGAGGIRTS